MSEKKKQDIPVHVGIIMDGNRRWAKERNLPTFEGHQKGYEKLKLASDWFFSRGVKILSFYAFSTENWQRQPEEVNYLMKLLLNAVEFSLREQAKKEGYKVLISGRLKELPGDLPAKCLEIIAETQANKRGIINFCLNYGGRAEIVDAVRKMMKNKVELEQVHEGMIKKYLYNGDLSDPDIIVRTSGEQRLSGFMMWQAAYSELFFIKKYWPDFEELDADMIIKEFAERKRRFGV
ncbi:di-trans,poly-cis-decaprenylcistransferase [Candidatus Falkowbacteria bacterium RIFCSPLOWO2_12_FULL_45_13]|uniref:Isoprenyl transferase n=2 Tax=Candidatus Falkowiibacteriota TaxID=1752728 RepID=A0A1F5SCJ8_9BACT|nr:MAG: di-trans,poly-cis-decaprenylcistransferase [Candidatus Falkowbacteria bacterium RIFCSPLOWO2_02_FULL_45_21]OGF29871.1 MAG: di-trans,poly-cis-decaprenylcistransferase [Candidatus Falkowbacteria bacterium RIFCSPLOWO2_12_FULL_45_13]